MNHELFDRLMDTLPFAFPTSRIVMSDGIKFEYWEALKDYSDDDFGMAIMEIKRRSGKFPDLPVIVQQIEATIAQKQKSDFDKRMEEHAVRKAERITVYTPHDLDSAYEKQHVKDTFAMIQEGLSNSDMVSALRKLGEKYPKEKWIPKLAAEMGYERTMAPSLEKVNGI